MTEVAASSSPVRQTHLTSTVLERQTAQQVETAAREKPEHIGMCCMLKCEAVTRAQSRSALPPSRQENPRAFNLEKSHKLELNHVVTMTILRVHSRA